MSKANSLLRGRRRDKLPLSKEALNSMSQIVEGRVELIIAQLMLASLETLKDDFGFKLDDVVRFRELTEIRFKINQLKK